MHGARVHRAQGLYFESEQGLAAKVKIAERTEKILDLLIGRLFISEIGKST